MYILKIFDQEDHGVVHEIETTSRIKMGNVFGCEIFFEAIDEIISGDVVLEFMVSEKNTVTFDVVLGAVPCCEGKNIIVDNEYQLPLYFEIGDKKIALGTEKEVITWKHNNNDSKLVDKVLDIPIVKFNTFDDSEKQNQVLSILQRYWVSFQIKSCQLARDVFAWLIRRYQQNKLYFSIVFSVSLLLAILSCFVVTYEYSTAKEVRAMDARLSKVAALKRTLAKLNYLNLWLENTDNGKFQLNGVLPKNEDVAVVKKDFAEFSDIINLHVYQKTSLINLINLFLKEANLGHLTASYDDVGRRIVLSGVITDFNKLDDVEIQLNTKLPGIGDIATTDVYDLEQINKDIGQVISSYQKSGNITVDNKISSTCTLSINGYLAEEDLQNLKKSLEELQDKYPVLQIKTSMQNILNAIPFKIETVYTGDPAYIELADGRKVFSGGSVDGFRVVAIDESQIVLDGKLKVTIPLSSLVESSEMATPDNAPYH